MRYPAGATRPASTATNRINVLHPLKVRFETVNSTRALISAYRGSAGLKWAVKRPERFSAIMIFKLPNHPPCPKIAKVYTAH